MHMLRNILPLLEKVSQFMSRAETVFGTFLVGAMFLVVLLNLFSRHVLASPFFWGEELSIYLFAWMAFVSIATAVCSRAHIAITAISSIFSAKCNHYLEAMNYSLIAAAFIVFISPTLEVMAILTPSPAMQIEEQYLYSIVPVVFCLITFHSLVNVVRSLVRAGD